LELGSSPAILIELLLFLLLLFVPLILIRFGGPATWRETRLMILLAWRATVAVYLPICILYATAYDRKLKK
jgi:hypothetical protein